MIIYGPSPNCHKVLFNLASFNDFYVQLYMSHLLTAIDKVLFNHENFYNFYRQIFLYDYIIYGPSSNCHR